MLLVAVALALVLVAPWAGVAAGQAIDPPVDAAGSERSDVDTRLVLQLGMVLALLYVAFVCVWLSRTRGGRRIERVLRRVGAWWSAILARVGFVGAPLEGAQGEPASICAIAWKRGRLRSRFQAVISTPGDRRCRVVAESAGLRWPPKDTRNPPTRELETALAALVAKIVAAGWEPVPSDGSWSERRFVWRAPNLVALDVGEAAPVPGPRLAPARRLPPAVVAVLVGVAAVAGLALALMVVRGTERAAPARPVPTTLDGGLRIGLPSGWAQAKPATVPGFSRPLGLANADGRLRAVVERLPATTPTLLPAAFARTVPSTRPRVVRLASGQPAWQYRFAKRNGSVTVVYAAPTTAGVATLACLSETGAAAVPRGCSTLAGELTVPDTRALELGVSSAFLSRLPCRGERARARATREPARARRAPRGRPVRPPRRRRSRARTRRRPRRWRRSPRTATRSRLGPSARCRRRQPPTRRSRAPRAPTHRWATPRPAAP